MKKLSYLFSFILLIACSSEEDPVTNPTPPVEVENPVAVDDSFDAFENEVLIISGNDLLENDETVDGARITQFDVETENGGSVTDNRDGTFSYEPPSNFQGTDTFTYTICVPLQSDRCATATVTIEVGDAGDPVATDDSYQTEEDESYTIINYLENDDLRDNAQVTEVGNISENATVSLEADGTIIYTPVEGFSGEDSFTYTICDDDETPNCSTATITITVNDEGDPVAENDQIFIESGSSDNTVTGLLVNDLLIDGAVLTSVEAGANSQVTLTEDLNIIYTPNSGFTGEDTFTYTICDDDNPEATCSTANVTVQVVSTYSFNITGTTQEYYDDAIFAQDATFLLESLRDFTTAQHTNILLYTDRHDYLYDADAALDDPSKVVLVYSGELRPDDEYQIGDLDESESFNTEHIYPQSRLNTEESISDLHLLRVVDVDVNSERLNYPFADGSGEYKLLEGNEWYPGDDWRGDVARIVMYVHLRYGDSFDEVGSLDLFLKWNVEDPVSEFEMQRNNVIEGAQGNRNPFIDNPYLATLIWGGETAENRW